MNYISKRTADLEVGDFVCYSAEYSEILALVVEKTNSSKPGYHLTNRKNQMIDLTNLVFLTNLGIEKQELYSDLSVLVLDDQSPF